MQIAKRVYSLAQDQNDSALMMGAYRALACTLYFLGDFETARQYAIVVFRSGARVAYSLRSKRSSRPLSLVCAIEALSEWHFGEFASCHANIAEAISLAKELNDMHALAVALFHAGILAHYQRNPAEVDAWHRI